MGERVKAVVLEAVIVGSAGTEAEGGGIEGVWAVRPVPRKSGWRHINRVPLGGSAGVWGCVHPVERPGAREVGGDLLGERCQVGDLGDALVIQLTEDIRVLLGGGVEVGRPVRVGADDLAMLNENPLFPSDRHAPGGGKAWTDIEKFPDHPRVGWKSPNINTVGPLDKGGHVGA